MPIIKAANAALDLYKKGLVDEFCDLIKARQPDILTVDLDEEHGRTKRGSGNTLLLKIASDRNADGPKKDKKIEMATFLLHGGTWVTEEMINAQNEEGSDSLFAATECSNIWLCRMLATHPLIKSEKNNCDHYPIHALMSRFDKGEESLQEILDILVEHFPETLTSVEVHATHSKWFYKSVLHYAIERYAPSGFLIDLADAIRKNCRHIFDHRDGEGYTPLHTLVRCRKHKDDETRELIETFIKHQRRRVPGVENGGEGLYAVNRLDKGKTVLNYAIQRGDQRMIEEILLIDAECANRLLTMTYKEDGRTLTPLQQAQQINNPMLIHKKTAIIKLLQDQMEDNEEKKQQLRSSVATRRRSSSSPFLSLTSSSTKKRRLMNSESPHSTKGGGGGGGHSAKSGGGCKPSKAQKKVKESETLPDDAKELRQAVENLFRKKKEIDTALEEDEGRTSSLLRLVTELNEAFLRLDLLLLQCTQEEPDWFAQALNDKYEKQVAALGDFEYHQNFQELKAEADDLISQVESMHEKKVDIMLLGGGAAGSAAATSGGGGGGGEEEEEGATTGGASAGSLLGKIRRLKVQLAKNKELKKKISTRLREISKDFINSMQEECLSLVVRIETIIDQLQGS